MRFGKVTLGRASRAVVPVRWTVCCALLLFLVLLAPAASANTSLFADDRICTLQNCEALSYYGLLVGTTSDTLALTADWNLNNVGIGIGTSSNFNRGSGANTANGPIDFADSVVYNSGNCDATGTTNYCGAGTLTGTAPSNTNASRVNSAETQLDAILAKLATYTTGNGTTTTLSTNPGAEIDVTLGLSGGTLKIFRNASAYATAGTITLGCGVSTCDANMLVVINVNGAIQIKNDIVLNDGLTADQVLFYSGNNNIDFNPTAAAITARGSFFVATGTATVGCTAGNCDPVSMYGRVYVDNGNLTLNDKGTAVQQSWTYDGVTVTPEPGTWAMMASGFAAFVWGIRRKRANRLNGK
jgi:hypothetical protein